MSVPSCPDRARLQSLLAGTENGQHAALITHLDECPHCRKALDELAGAADVSATALAELGRPSQSDEANLAAALDALKATPPEPQPHPELDFALDFLEPSDDPGHLGRFASYDITEELGRGGHGVVFKGFDPGLHRVVAIKVLAPVLASNGTARKRFDREARAAAAVSHDHVVTIHAVDEHRGLPYLVMQYVCGMSLQEKIHRDGPLETKEILRIGMQIASGLAAAHAQGNVHRDIKPSNILLENGVERVKITDFGLARAVDDAALTQSGVVAGTPQYMAPEQARGEPLDHRADLFSLGSVLYAMCTGRPPFRTDTTMAVLRKVSDETPTPIRQINADVPDWLADVVTRLHAKDPDQRYQTAAEVAGVLGRHLEQLQHPSLVQHAMPTNKPDARTTAPSADTQMQQRTTRAKPRRTRWLAAAAVVLVAMALGITEATGVTEVTDFVATVLRIRTPHGTLVVEVDDPAIEVTVEDGGETLTLTGVGPHTIRLSPGRHPIQATRNGLPLPTQWVTLTRGGKQVVSVSLEATQAATATDLEPDHPPVGVPGTELTPGAVSATPAVGIPASGDDEGGQNHEERDHLRAKGRIWERLQDNILEGGFSSKLALAAVVAHQIQEAKKAVAAAESKADREVAEQWLNQAMLLQRDLQLERAREEATRAQEPRTDLGPDQAPIGVPGTEIKRPPDGIRRRPTGPEPLATLVGHLASVGYLAFSSDGSMLASASDDNSARIWDVASRTLKQTILPVGFVASQRFVQFAHDDKQLATYQTADIERAKAGVLRLWQLETGEALGNERRDGALAALSRGTLAVGHSGGRVSIVDLAVGEDRPVGYLRGPADLKGLALSADGKVLAVARGSGRRLPHEITLYHVATREEIRRFIVSGWIDALALSSGGERLAAAGPFSAKQAAVNVWNVEDGKLVATRNTPEGEVSCLAVTTGGELLVAGGQAGITVWSMVQDSRPLSLRGDDSQPEVLYGNWINSVALSPDGKLLASGGADAKIRLWDVAALTDAANADAEPVQAAPADHPAGGPAQAPAATPSEPTTADADEKPQVRQLPAWRRHIEDGLGKRVDVDFNNVPLDELLQWLREQLDANVVLDRRAFETWPVNPQVKFTLVLKNVPLKLVLFELLEPLRMDYLLRNEALVLTSRPITESDLETQIYSVAHLLPAGPGGKPPFDPKYWQDLLTTLIAPGSWTTAGGPGVFKTDDARALLIISQTQPIHRRIARLLEDMKPAPASGGASAP